MSLPYKFLVIPIFEFDRRKYGLVSCSGTFGNISESEWQDSKL
jgi:hypothetical protein